MAFVEYGLVAIADMPDDEEMADLSLAVSAAITTSRSKTIKLLTMDQEVESMKNAQGVVTSYKPL